MDDEDDDMADLFSFGADTATPTETPATTEPTPSQTADTKDTSAIAEIDDLFADHSDDSFLKMLDDQPLPEKTNGGAKATGDANADAPMNDQETQDILDWLEEDDTDADALLAAVADESAQKAKQQNQSQPSTAAAEEPVAPAPAPPPAPVFTSLQEALESPQSTKLQILEQWEHQEKSTLQDPKLRPLLWCRLICGKSVDELTSSSLADSFQAFKVAANDTNPQQKEKNQALENWIRSESAKLAPRVVRAHPNAMTVNEAEEALQSILLYHYHSNNTQNDNSNTNNADPTKDDTTTEEPPAHDPLLPPVVCAILSAGVPKLATPVLMSHIVPSFMPFVALTPEERGEASKLLHSQFYLLACYHLPMLVYHLDRYVPGWYWVRKQQKQNSNQDEKENCATHRGRHLKDQGVIPPSWLMTHLVGESGGTFLDPNRLLQLLDLVFTNENNSLRFFLVLAVLEQHSDSWLELTGDALMESLLQNMQDSSAMTMEEWANRARSMKQATPDSVVDRLRVAEDEAVRMALKERQKRAEAALKARLEAEAAAYREAQERKAEEARIRLTRARLVAYYRRFNPSKEANIDKIMETYRDKYDELDKKLKKKYGVGFNPALNPNKKKKTMTEAANESMKKTMQSMNESMKRLSTTSKADDRYNPLDDGEDTDEIRKKEHRVSVSVKVGETLPYICMSREQANDIRRVCLQKDLPMPLRFYLVDSRSEEAGEKQGRFPTAARLSPETLMDPELLQKYEDSFEAVRGSVHICVMGEGHSAIPALYNQKLTPGLEEYMQEDESRTNNCALFFVKRGFPFVSVLEGGFASAHAWLLREGAKKGFDVKALLVDYDPAVSLFGQMEKIRSDFPQGGYKAQRAFHNLLESSYPTAVRGNLAEAEATKGGTSHTKANAATAGPLRKAGEDTASTGLSSFFGRRQQVAADKQPAAKTLNAGEKKDESLEANAAQGRFTKWRQAAASAINATDEMAQPTSSQPKQQGQGTTPAGSRFGEAFGMRRSTSKDDPNDPAANRSPQPPNGDASQPKQNRFGGAFGMLRSAGANDDSGVSAASNNPKTNGAGAVQPVPAKPNQPASVPAPSVNRFGGAFGRLRNVSKDEQNDVNGKPQPMLRRNPFARFGGGGAAAKTGGPVQTPATSDAAKAAMTSASSAFGGFMKVAQNSKPTFARSASSDSGEPKHSQPAATIVSLPPRPDETTSEESISFETNGPMNGEGNAKSEPALRAV